MSGDDGVSQLRDVTDTIPPGAVDSFAVLANETRLSTLLVLWEAEYGAGDTNRLSFSALRDRVGMRDSGQFNYHLDHLTDQFVRKTDEGYALTQGGARIIRTVLAWEHSEDPRIDPTEIDRPCPFCGAPVRIRYEEELVEVECTDCEGGGAALQNALLRGPLPPAGVATRTPDEVLSVTTIYHLNITAAMLRGVCPVCTGTVDRRLELCSDHAPVDGSCPTCRGRFLGTVHMACQVCHAPNTAPSWLAVMDHPDVVSFFHDRGVNLWADLWDGLFYHGADAAEAPVRFEPPTVRVTLEVDGDQLNVDLRDDLSVVVADSSRD